MKHFSISFYDDNDAAIYPAVRKYHKTVQGAVWHCKARKIPLSMISITQWNEDEIIGQCSLSEAFEAKYRDLTF